MNFDSRFPRKQLKSARNLRTLFKEVFVMYGLKRTILFFVAASFLAGFAVDTFAQTYADPQGVRIRVNKTNEWVAIGDSVDVTVFTRGVTLQDVIVSISAIGDTVTAAEFNANNASGTSMNDLSDRRCVREVETHLLRITCSERKLLDLPDEDDPRRSHDIDDIVTTFGFSFRVLGAHNIESDNSAVVDGAGLRR